MRPIITLLAAPALALSAGLALAQDAEAPMEGMDHGTMAAEDTMSPSAMTAYMKAMDDMTTAMADMESTGDADFLL